jgi:glutamate-1-semialdehyde 2,1-aminomutase
MSGAEYYAKARRLIPGGTQLLSKRPEMFLPERWPSYYSKAKGIEVTGLDGERFLDMSIMGVGACVLGYADPDVDAAAHAAIDAGVMCTLNAPEEVTLAEQLIRLHPWAEKVRYARGGGEAMSLAVRIARAHTKKGIVAFSGYHGWTDWYLAANLGGGNELDGHLMPGLMPAGVPRELRGTALPFHYNRIDELKKIVAEHRHALGAIVMEPQRSGAPDPGFLEAVRAIADEIGAVLIFDEITTGWRMCPGGIHRLLPVKPDIAVFAKAMANGYAMSAVVGRGAIMESAQDTFISSTNWTERIGPSAALAAIAKYERAGVHQHIARIGARVMDGWRKAGAESGLTIHADGLPSLCHFGIEHADELNLSTLFTLRMLERGWLAYTQFKPSLAHTEAVVDRYLADCTEVFNELREAGDRGDAAKRLNGPAARRGFYRLTS